jgi:hypothetical protein
MIIWTPSLRLNMPSWSLVSHWDCPSLATYRPISSRNQRRAHRRASTSACESCKASPCSGRRSFGRHLHPVANAIILSGTSGLGQVKARAAKMVYVPLVGLWFSARYVSKTSSTKAASVSLFEIMQRHYLGLDFGRYRRTCKLTEIDEEVPSRNQDLEKALRVSISIYYNFG